MAETCVDGDLFVRTEGGKIIVKSAGGAEVTIDGDSMRDEGRREILNEVANHKCWFPATRDANGVPRVAECFYCGNQWSLGTKPEHSENCFHLRARASQVPR